MKIIINRTAEQEYFFKKLIFRHFAIKLYLLQLLIIVIGILLLFSRSEVNGIEQPFWNLGSAIGLGFIMIGISRIITITKKHFSNLKESSSTTIIIDQDEILYQKHHAQSNFKWGYFKFHQINNKFILLKKDPSVENTLILFRNEISEDEFSLIHNQLFQHQIVRK